MLRCYRPLCNIFGLAGLRTGGPAGLDHTQRNDHFQGLIDAHIELNDVLGGDIMIKPEVGFGVVGTNTVVTSSPAFD